MAATVHLIRVAPGADPFPAITPSRETLVVCATPALADEAARRGVPVCHTLTFVADELVRRGDPDARPLLPRHVSLLGRRAPAFSRGLSHQIAGTVAELKHSFVPVHDDRLPAPIRELTSAWEKGRLQLNRLAPEDRLREAAKRWNTGTREPWNDITSAILVGFREISPLVQSLVQAMISTLDSVTVIRDDDLEYPDWLAAPADERTIESTPPPDRLLIEAPGATGECRMIARELRERIDNGVSPAEIVIAARDPAALGDLLEETFSDYGLPLCRPDRLPLHRHSAVAALMRFWSLPAGQFPFPGVATALRSTFFRPAWPELAAQPQLPARSEWLLRVLNEPRGRENYLAAVRKWIVSPPTPLEDESAEASHRARIGRLATRCEPFLIRFFSLWDDRPDRASPVQWQERFVRFAREFGFGAPDDAEGIHVLVNALHGWAHRDAPSLGITTLTDAEFADVLTDLTHDLSLPRPQPRNGIRLLTPEVARHLPCRVLVLMELGEGAYPRAESSESLLNNADRSSLSIRAAGSRADDAALFERLTRHPRQQLILSYAARDTRGEATLPCTSLRDFLARHADSIRVISRHLPIERYAEGTAYSATELRVQCARALAARPASSLNHLSTDTAATLLRARLLTEQRFRNPSYSAFDGRLGEPDVLASLQTRFGPSRIFSASALETYIACPFRFWLERVLDLEPLDEPGEEIESARRGQLIHRAMTRLHRRIRKMKAHPTEAAITKALTHELETATEEYARDAATPAGRILWRLEGRRLIRSAPKYAGMWNKFREPWADDQIVPVPARFEQEFGGSPNPLAEEGAEPPAPVLTFTVGDVAVTIGGKIDRIDTVPLPEGDGFWIIDYKTGAGSYYSAKSVQMLENVQLPLYALAAERVVFRDRPARPLGLAYWMLPNDGPKNVMPGHGKALRNWFHDPSLWPQFREQLEAWVARLVSGIRQGDFALAPRSEHCTDRCPFGPTCRIASHRQSGREPPYPLPIIGK